MKTALWILLLTALALRPSLAQQLPAPTGPWAIGTTIFEWQDSARAEIVPFSTRTSSGALSPRPVSGFRRVIVQLWYPTSTALETAAPYNPDLAGFDRLLDSERVGRLRSMRTHAQRNTSIGGTGPLPIVLFSPGGGTFRSDYTALYEELASRGFAVASVSEPGVTLMLSSDGGIGTDWPGFDLPPGMSSSLARDSLKVSSDYITRVRDALTVADIRFVIDRLGALDGGHYGGQFAGHLDLRHVGAAGHSTGGAIVAAASMADHRISALVVYDVILPRTLFGEVIAVPFMMLRTDDPHSPPRWSDVERETFQHVQGPAYDVVVHGAGHNTFSDRPLQTRERFRYALTPERGVSITRAFTVAFFERYLTARRQAPLEHLQFEFPETTVHAFNR